MNICSGCHEEIFFASKTCPLCAAMADADEKERAAEDEIQELKDEIQELKKPMKALAITFNEDLSDPSFDVARSLLDARVVALDMARSLVRITNDKELADFIAAASMLRESVTKPVADAYKVLKAPALDYVRKLDKTNHAIVDEPQEHIARLNAEASRYVTARDAVKRAEADSERLRIAAAELDAAATGDTDALRDLQEQRNAVAVVTRVEDALARTGWTFDMLDAAALYAARPDLVELCPRRREILAAIAGGVNLPGIRVFQQTKISAQ